MEKWGFNLLDTDIIKEIANVGSGNAATSLAKLLNRRIDMSVPEVAMPEFKNLADMFDGSDTVVAGVLVSISGDIDGMMMYIMKEKSACSIVNRLLGRHCKSFSELNDIDFSALTEIGNILISSYLTAMSNLMNFTIKQSTPGMSIDMAGAVLSVPAAEFGKVADNVFMIKSVFNQNDDLSGYFMLIPDVEKDKNIKI